MNIIIIIIIMDGCSDKKNWPKLLGGTCKKKKKRYISFLKLYRYIYHHTVSLALFLQCSAVSSPAFLACFHPINLGLSRLHSFMQLLLLLALVLVMLQVPFVPFVVPFLFCKKKEKKRKQEPAITGPIPRVVRSLEVTRARVKTYFLQIYITNERGENELYSRQSQSQFN